MKKILITFLLLFPLMGFALKALPTFNFDKFTLPKKPYLYLICPKGRCDNKQNENSPVFDVSRDKLEAAWMKLKSTLPRTRQVAHDEKLHQYTYIQRSFVFHFPDYFFIRFVDLGTNKSTVMMYSQSRYGHYDFGINKKRAKGWLKLLKKVVNSPSE